MIENIVISVRSYITVTIHTAILVHGVQPQSFLLQDRDGNNEAKSGTVHLANPKKELSHDPK